MIESVIACTLLFLRSVSRLLVQLEVVSHHVWYELDLREKRIIHAPSTFGLTFSWTTLTCASLTAYLSSAARSAKVEYRPGCELDTVAGTAILPQLYPLARASIAGGPRCSWM